MTAYAAALEVASEVVVSEHYDELRTLLDTAVLRKVMITAFLKKNFPAHAARLAAGEFTTIDLLDALDES